MRGKLLFGAGPALGSVVGAAGGDGGTPGDDAAGTARTRTRRVRSSGDAPAKADD